MATSSPILPNQGGSAQPYVPTTTTLAGATSAGVGGNLNQGNGITAGYGLSPGENSNPPLSGGGYSQYGGNPAYAIQRIGYLENVTQGEGEGAKLYFLYNPNDIQVGFSFDVSQLPPVVTASGSTGVNQDSAVSSVTAQTVSWSLYFDRTYDLLYGANPGGNRGVLKDVGALYAVLGAWSTTGAAQGVPIMTQVQAIFGQTDNGQIWGFTGYITSVGIDYGIFRYNMIPSKCEIDLTMTVVYVSTSAPPSSPGGSGTTAATFGSGSTNPLTTLGLP